MSNELHYKSNLRDLEFNLFEFLDIGRTSLGREPFGLLAEDTAREALRAYDKLATSELAKGYASSDRTPPTLDAEGNVRLPEALHRAWKSYHEGDWHKLSAPEHLGGMAAPPTLTWALFELTAGSNPALGFYLFGGVLARVLDRLATPSQKARYLPQMIDRCWGGAMVLTEPDAGSDVGAARATARHLGGDEWAITGTKRFITNGDFDIPENVVHLVLARPEGAGPGTKGLSMFIVPKYWVNADGSMGERNGMKCTALEKKMGIKASATCEMSYGDEGLCRGLLVGDEHRGIAQMFHVIENARMGVGIKSVAQLSAGYLQALSYARDRVQGPDLLRAAEKDSPRVRILAHPDVRRMLMTQKAHAEGLRALALFTASIQDQVELLGGHGNDEAKKLDRLNDLLLPLVKGFSSERAFELLALSLQCFGGSGYLQDWPVEQYLRDQKIDTLYEGTTQIQALDLIFRKLGRDGGATLMGLFGRVQKTLTENEGGEALAQERAMLAEALEHTQALFTTLLGRMQESLYHVGLQGNRVLFALSELVVGWLLVRHAAVALAKREGANQADKDYYDGKVASARWWCRDVLPDVAAVRRFVERGDLSLMELGDEAF